jgi:AcrR family transcriptional regulator
MVDVSPAPSAFDVREALLMAARAELVEHGRSAISLRAVARRAGVSHAAPKYHFGDRAGLLTAVASEGFRELARALERISETDPQKQLAALGEAYVDFGLANPALSELMFQPGELQTDDNDLAAAQVDAISALVAAVGPSSGRIEAASSAPPRALISWALAHGLAVLARDGALDAFAGASHTNVADLAHELVQQFARMTPPG